MQTLSQDTLLARRILKVDGISYVYYDLKAAGDVQRLPYALKILLENLLRFEDNSTIQVDDIQAVVDWGKNRCSDREILYYPSRILMQDFTGVPAIVDLATLRDAVAASSGSPEKVNPLTPVDLVIDHSVTVDHYASEDALTKNITLEFQRNSERYAFLRWGQIAFNNFRVIPPGTGICHQINLEFLAKCTWVEHRTESTPVIYPDTVIGTDSHTTMINGLGVLGWGVGGIEAEAVMLGQPLSMLIPEVVGVKLYGHLYPGTTATDLVLTITHILRHKGVVSKFVEFFGPGLDTLTVPDRATIANMAPEYGATCGIFPIDHETINYLTLTGRDQHQVRLVEAYAKSQGLWRDSTTPPPIFTDLVEIDLATITASLAGPRRPQDLVALTLVKDRFLETLDVQNTPRTPVHGTNYTIGCGDVIIAAITSCTNTSNPSVMITAGLLAKKAVEKGLVTKPWVKTSLAPGSQAVSDYLKLAGLQPYLDLLGFNTVGYGCTTCIGNSGPLLDALIRAIESDNIITAAVLSGNRNFEGRISPYTRVNYLASPPLVVAYALSGSITVNLTQDPLGKSYNGQLVFLKDIWPTFKEIQETMSCTITKNIFCARYSNTFVGSFDWQQIKTSAGTNYNWSKTSTYVKSPPYFTNQPEMKFPILNARCLVMLGDSVTTDHISPAGSIRETSPAGRYLQDQGVAIADFNSYGARRGNHEVMMRGTFANVRIRNEIVPGLEGGITCHHPSGSILSVYDAAMRYRSDNTPLLIIAGLEYGTGSSRDWAAKGPALLGVRAVIAESFERIHRTNLVGMGVLPLQFSNGANRKVLCLDGSEKFDIIFSTNSKPSGEIQVTVYRSNQSHITFTTICRIDTADEMKYYHHGGILPYVLNTFLQT